MGLRAGFVMVITDPVQTRHSMMAIVSAALEHRHTMAISG